MATTIQGGDTTICYGSLRISTDENNSIDSTQGDWTFVEGLRTCTQLITRIIKNIR